MIELKYVASSGNEYHLNTDGILTRAANYHAWSWAPRGTDLKYGQRVADFGRDAVTYQAELVFNATRLARRSMIDAMHLDMEKDIRDMKPGRIYWRDWYIECYINGSSTAPDDIGAWTDNTIEIFCPYPFWIREETRSFLPSSQSMAGSAIAGSAQASGGSEGLDYPYDYPYDYFIGNPGAETWVRTHPFAANFKLTIYGAVQDPQIYINSHEYSFAGGLSATQYAVIDSRNNTIVKYFANGATQNYFDRRNKVSNIFEKIPGGSLDIVWSGAFGFDLTIYDERSEPTWS